MYLLSTKTVGTLHQVAEQLLAAIAFALASATRSNGTVYAGFFAHRFLVQVVRRPSLSVRFCGFLPFQKDLKYRHVEHCKEYNCNGSTCGDLLVWLCCISIVRLPFLLPRGILQTVVWQLCPIALWIRAGPLLVNWRRAG